MACCHPSGPSRRQVLGWAGAGVAAAALAACAGEEAAPLPQPGERLLPLDEVPVGGSAAVRTADGAELIVSRVGEEEVVALSAVCTHEGCTVRREREELACPCHGSRYAVADGAVIQGPADEPLPQVRVRIEAGDIIVG